MKNNQNFWKFGRPDQTNSSSKTRFWCIWQIINNVELTCILFPGSLQKYILDKT